MNTGAELNRRMLKLEFLKKAAQKNAIKQATRKGLKLWAGISRRYEHEIQNLIKEIRNEKHKNQCSHSGDQPQEAV